MAAFNTTVASFNVGYADFFTEHMKKLCNPVAVPEIPVEPLACTNLPRSLTDSCINYSCLEEGENIEGTNNFVLKNGMLDLTVATTSAPGSAMWGSTSSTACCSWELFPGWARSCPSLITRKTRRHGLKSQLAIALEGVPREVDRFQELVGEEMEVEEGEVYVNKDSLNNIVDFLHALLGFCMEPITDSEYIVYPRG
ncbi:hypothetical protein XENOCAPTIV_017794 [Xenoophorus captivus]|uniref:Uncharacterized protein n=1 Tax=Xenoophorus captivus TaxID=1517983 RepID=A0ABV0QX35_9TELE